VFSFLLLSVLSLYLTGCFKENHTIRFKNQYHEAISDVRIGTAYIGTVRASSTSHYESINTGNFDLTGVSESGAPLSGSGTISGKGKHKWTLTLSSAGTIA